MRRDHTDDPVLITSAPVSPDDEYDKRRKKYAIMMGLRAVCVLVAALTYRYSLWIALACVVGGAVLPWCAVMIANDRPARRPSEHTHRDLSSGERALPPGPNEDRVVDG